MYKLKDIAALHLESTEKCNASCLQCDRNKSGGEENPFIKNRDFTLEMAKKAFTKDFILQINRLWMCGNYGDPICSPHTLEIFKYLRSVNSKIRLSMNTNGSMQPKEWWEELAKIGVIVRFSVDGLEDTQHIYRQTTDWNKIMENVKAFIGKGGEAWWDYLVFEYNEHQVEDARKLANELGFVKFTAKKTARFLKSVNYLHEGKLSKTEHQGFNRKGEKSHTLTLPKNKKHVNVTSEKEAAVVKKYGSLKEYFEQTEIGCRSVNFSELYISAEGLVLPCCWLAGQMYKWHEKEKSNPIWEIIGDKDRLSIKHHSLEEIFESGIFEEIQDTWKHNNLRYPDKPGVEGRLRTCAQKCGKEIDPFGDQFK